MQQEDTMREVFREYVKLSAVAQGLIFLPNPYRGACFKTACAFRACCMEICFRAVEEDGALRLHGHLFLRYGMQKLPFRTHDWLVLWLSVNLLKAALRDKRTCRSNCGGL